jgi:hypothetical protein
VIVALAHQHRRSEYWRGRIEESAATYEVARIAA